MSINVNNNNNDQKVADSNNVVLGTGDTTPPPINVLAYALGLLLDSSNVAQQSAVVGAKNLEANAQAQANQNNIEGQVNFVVISQKYHMKRKYVSNAKFSGYIHKRTPVHIKNQKLQAIETQNEQIQKERDYFANNLTLLQQNSSITSSNESMYTNNSMQSLEAATSLLQTCNTLSNQFASMQA